MPRLRGKAGQRAFLAAFAECASITKAAKAAGVNRRAHYDWMEADKSYPERFEVAQEQAASWLEDEATKRAVEGVTQVERYQGKPVGTRRIYSDGLMMFLLRGLMPAKYRQGIELTGQGGGPVQSEHRIVFVKPGELPTK